MPRPFQSIKSSAEEGRGHAGSGTAASVRPSACTDVEMKLHEEFRYTQKQGDVAKHHGICFLQKEEQPPLGGLLVTVLSSSVTDDFSYRTADLRFELSNHGDHLNLGAEPSFVPAITFSELKTVQSLNANRRKKDV